MEDNPIETPVTRLLKQTGIPFSLLVHTAPALTVEDAAHARGVLASEMIKCLVFLPRKGPRVVVACLPGDRRLSMAKLKAAAGVREFRPASPDAIVEAIGYPVGAIPPVALPVDVVVIADFGILSKAQVNISAGCPFAGVGLPLEELRRVLKCTFSDLVE